MPKSDRLLGAWRELGVAWLAVLALTATLPASAEARIVIGDRIGDVSLGDSSSAVRAKLGKPARVQTYPGGSSIFYARNAPVYWITLTSANRVRGIETRSTRQKTSRGIGPGSSLSALRAAYPRAVCKDGFVAERTCELRSTIQSRSVLTQFVFFGGRVTIVDIGQIGEFG